MKKDSLKTVLPTVLLISVAIALAVTLLFALASKSSRAVPEAAILPVSPSPGSSGTPRAAVPKKPSASPALTPVPFDDGTYGRDFPVQPKAPFWSEGIMRIGDVYKSPTLSVNVTTHIDSKTYKKALVYYVADIYVSDVTQIRTAAASGNFANAGRGKVLKMAQRENALLAISGDYCGNRGGTLIIRNGEVFRKKIGSSDICVLYRNGEMQAMRSDGVEIDDILKKDPWQAWQFGPSLLDSNGKPRKSFPTSTINGNNPRSCIGYYEPGHYCFVLVDGRQKTSRGLSLKELASLMYSLGCRQAYNLDGGASAHMFWQDRIYNIPSGGGRSISDIVYIAKETYPTASFFCGKAGLSE